MAQSASNEERPRSIIEDHVMPYADNPEDAHKVRITTKCLRNGHMR